MLENLYDYFSLIFPWRWPKVNGELTAVHIRYMELSNNDANSLRVILEYKFSLGEDGPYTGETSWSPLFALDVTEFQEKMKVGQAVTVRYRKDDPSVNKLDRSVFRDFAAL
jgi:hypothetical protein